MSQQSEDRRKSSNNKLIIAVSTALVLNFISNYFLMSKSLTQIESELVYIRKGVDVSAINASKLDKREGFMSTTNFRLDMLERKTKKIK